MHEVKSHVLSKAIGRKTQEQSSGICELREPVVSYNPLFDPRKEPFKPKKYGEMGDKCMNIKQLVRSDPGQHSSDQKEKL